MLLKEILGNLRDQNQNANNVVIEKVQLEWFELDKRLLRKVTDRGTDVGIMMDGSQRLRQGDILYSDDQKIIAIELLLAETIVLEPQTMVEMAQVGYQLGNRHTPIFMEKEQILVPFDSTIVELFQKLQIPTKVEKRRLEYALQPASSHHH